MESHPVRGAWIEIRLMIATAKEDNVAPRKGCVVKLCRRLVKCGVDGIYIALIKPVCGQSKRLTETIKVECFTYKKSLNFPLDFKTAFCGVNTLD